MRLAVLMLLAVSMQGELRLEYCRESLTGTHCRYREYIDGVPTERVTFRSAAAKPSLSFQSGGSATALLNARIFNPNPVAAINDPSLMDTNDSPTAVPAHAYETVAVDLLGPHARLVDVQAPFTTQPDPNAPLMFDRGDDRFEPVNAYFHVDRTQRHLQSLGYSGTRQLVAYPIEIDALALNGADASQFRPSMQIGRGSLLFGSGGTDDAEDADLVVHEYGHAILEWIAPGTFLGTFASESRALSEGIGDYLAFSAHYDERVASGRDPFCFADWDVRCWTDAASEGCGTAPGTDCLRRLDSPRTMADYQRAESGGAEHRNGQIWSSALREIFLTLGARTTDTLVIESLFAVPPNPTFAIMARRLIETDRVLYNGAHIATICATMTARGIAVSCDGTPRGELTHVPGVQPARTIPDADPSGITSTIVVTDTRAIERVAVRVDIEHPTRGDLRLELHAPDGTRVLLLDASPDVTRDIHATYGIDAASAESLDILRGRSAAGEWRLVVADLRGRDVGTLQSWSLVFQFAGDEPLAGRPRGEKSQMIPVVAHLANYASDVYLANVTDAAQTATLIFTRSGFDGTHAFSAIDVLLEPGQSTAFDDVVSSAFFTTGSGSLEVLGDVLVRTRLRTGLTLGQEVPPVAPSTRVWLIGQPDPHARYNLGITETAGRRTTVLIDGTREVIVEPFSHLQIAGDVVAFVESDTPVIAYLSQLDTLTGDAMFLTAAASGIAPAIGTSAWRTDLWTPAPFEARYRGINIAGGAGIYPDLVGDVAPGTAGALVSTAGWTRIVHGATTQLIPLRELDDRREQHLIGLANDATRRTNIGIVTDGFAIAEVVVYDAGGTEVERHFLVTEHGLAQTALIANGAKWHVEIRHLAGDRIRAYASVIDRRSGDAAFVDGQ